MRWIKCLASAGLAVLLGGCVTNLAPTLSADAAPSTVNGVIAGEFSRVAPTGVAFIVRNTSTNKEYALSLGGNALSNSKVYQQINAIELPPGDYVISQWEPFDLLTKKSWGRNDQNIAPLNKPFTVRAGQVTFLGSFNVTGFDSYSSSNLMSKGVEETKHWSVHPVNVAVADARTAFLGAYPGYAKDEFVCLRCTEMLSGDTRVKDVVANPQAYLASQFVPGAMAPEVVNMIRASDNEPAHFSHIVMHLTWKFSFGPAEASTSVDEVRTLSSQGGPFVQTLTEQSHAGKPIGQSYALTYRNVLDLKNQRLDLTQEFVPPAKEMGVVERFDSLSSVDAGAQYAFSVGTRVPVNKFTSGSASCKSEGKLAASSLNASLTGDAIKVVCSYYNINSQLLTKNRFAYLPQYGVGVPLGTQTARGHGEAVLTAITVQ